VPQLMQLRRICVVIRPVNHEVCSE
jgi:hypothetical protein